MYDFYKNSTISFLVLAHNIHFQNGSTCRRVGSTPWPGPEEALTFTGLPI